MAVSTTTNRVPFAGNGVTTQFSFPHHVESTSHLVVITKVDSTGVETTKTITTHYTVSGTLDANGAYSSGVTVTMLSAPASGVTLLIYNDPTLTQTLDLGDNDSRPAVTLERRLDQMTIAMQRLDSRVDRCVRLPEAFTATFDPILPGLMDAADNGLLLLNSGATGFAAAADWPTTTDIADAEANAAAAAASASAAAASAIAAATAETNAETAEANAETAETNAETAETNAETAATNAAASASTATTQASNASTSASTATTQASNAATSASTATTQASNASTSASTASTQASNASTSASNAATSASNALTSANNAAASEAAAAGYAASFLPESYEIVNAALACSVGSNALTIALKDRSGSDPSAGSAVKIGFRSATAATGTFSEVSVTGALSTVISSGSTAGHASGVAQYIYVYAINNAGTVELAWSSALFDQGSRVSTTAEGGAGAADSNRVMYSTTARANVACRLIGRLLSSQATAGTWTAVPTEISLWPFAKIPVIARYRTAAGQSIANSTVVRVDYGTKDYDSHNAVTTGGSWVFTAPEARYYLVGMLWTYNIETHSGTSSYTGYLYKNGSAFTHMARERTENGAASIGPAAFASTIIQLAIGDTIDFRVSQDGGATETLVTDSNQNWVSIVGLGD